MVATPSWRKYEERVAAFLAQLGFEVQLGEAVHGTRADHAVDVTARMSVAGMKQLWVVECKDWNRPVPKERVLTLRYVVEDVGADRGLLLCEAGFQSGAIDAAQNTNISLTSLKEFENDLASEVATTRAMVLDDRAARIGQAFLAIWDLPEEERDRILSRYTGPAGFSFLKGTPNAIVGLTARLSQLRTALEEARFGRWPVAFYPLDHRDDELLDITAWEGLFFAAEHMLTTCERFYEHMTSSSKAKIEDWRELQPEELSQLLAAIRARRHRTDEQASASPLQPGS